MAIVLANLNKTADMSTLKCATNLQKMASSEKNNPSGCDGKCEKFHPNVRLFIIIINCQAKTLGHDVIFYAVRKLTREYGRRMLKQPSYL